MMGPGGRAATTIIATRARCRQPIAIHLCPGGIASWLRVGGDTHLCMWLRPATGTGWCVRRRALVPAALADADALAIVTEWKEFRAPDFSVIKSSLKNPVIFDGRNLYEPKMVREAGLEYFPIGRL